MSPMGSFRKEKMSRGLKHDLAYRLGRHHGGFLGRRRWSGLGTALPWAGPGSSRLEMLLGVCWEKRSEESTS